MWYVCSGWAYHQWSTWGRNKQMMGKKLTLSAQWLSCSKENIRNVKHLDMFTHLSVIQIFRLRLKPDVHQIPSNPTEMVWPNLPQSMWPRLESRGEKGGMCVCVCVCFAFQAGKTWTPSNAAAFLHGKHCFLYLWPKRPPSGGQHTTQNIFKRKTAAWFLFFHPVSHRELLHGASERRTTPLHYITLGSMRGRHEPLQPTVCIWWHHYDSWNHTPSTLCTENIQVHVNGQGMCRNTITSTAQALNCAIILLQRTAGPVAPDLKALRNSWASPSWLVLPLYRSVLEQRQQHHCVMYSWDNALTQWLHGHQIWGWTPVAKWLLHRAVGGRTEITLTCKHTHTHDTLWWGTTEIHTHAHRAFIALQLVNSNITWPSAVIQTHFPL